MPHRGPRGGAPRRLPPAHGPATDVIISGGEDISSMEVEQALSRTATGEVCKNELRHP
ncbi:hypothetical protein RCG96_14200 [Kocuria sp. CPCC 205236]